MVILLQEKIFGPDVIYFVFGNIAYCCEIDIFFTKTSLIVARLTYSLTKTLLIVARFAKRTWP